MNCQFLRVTHFVALCWTAGGLRSQQMSDQRTFNSDNGNLESSYFFYQRPEYPRDCYEIRDQCLSDISSGVYLIKPDGYPEPFKVYCDNTNSEIWMVIQRRVDGSVDFNRNWIDYKVGFGFLSHEIWIGNEKLSYLTNQKKCELLINVTNANGASCSVTYDVFRISDEFGDYTLTSLGEYSGNMDDCFTVCPENMSHGNCSCQRTCEDPHHCHDTCAEDNTCACSEGFYVKGEDCVPAEECGCYDSGKGAIISEGEFYVNDACTRRGVCNNGQLSWDDSYRCSPDAVCEERDNVRQCYCNPGYSGDGVTCTPLYADCKEIYDSGVVDSGIYTITPSGWPGPPFEVYCNMTDGGGWTTFQRRVDGTIDFYRNWTSYREGFGSPDHEFWLGNEKLYYLTNQKRYTIRIDLVDKNGLPFYAKYDYFRINNEHDLYRLSQVGAYTGNADDGGHGSNGLGYSFSYHRGRAFSTYDRDNDGYNGNNNCAINYHGAWWYGYCEYSNLNGGYSPGSSYHSIRWRHLPGSEDFFLKFAEMNVRPFETI